LKGRALKYFSALAANVGINAPIPRFVAVPMTLLGELQDSRGKYSSRCMDSDRGFDRGFSGREVEVFMQQTLSHAMSHALKPLCPRDDHPMHYEANGIQWKNELGDGQSLPSYHCGYVGCSVRYTHEQGYFTVIKTLEHPYFVEEPATNLMQCPQHGAWLYLCRDGKDSRFLWRCGVEDCSYTHADVSRLGLRE
jgi:hypothetical protein